MNRCTGVLAIGRSAHGARSPVAPLFAIVAVTTAITLDCRSAAACSPAEETQSATVPGVVGPQPLLFAAGGERPQLTRPPSESSIPLDEVQIPELAGTGVVLLRPRAPLPEGSYRLSTGEELVVREGATEDPPALVGPAFVRPRDTTGEISCDGCGGGASVTVDIPGASRTSSQASGNVLLTIRRDDGAVVKRLFHPFRGTTTSASIFMYAFLSDGSSLFDQPFCVSVAGISWSGAVGPTLEAGCPELPGGCACRSRRRDASWAATVALFVAALVARARLRRFDVKRAAPPPAS